MVKPVQLHKSIEDEHERCLRSRVDIELHRLMDLAMGRHFGTWKSSGHNKPIDKWYWRFKSLKNEVRRNEALRADGQTGTKPKDTGQNTAVFFRALWLHFLAADPKWEWLRKLLQWWADLNGEKPPTTKQNASPQAAELKAPPLIPASREESGRSNQVSAPPKARRRPAEQKHQKWVDRARALLLEAKEAKEEGEVTIYLNAGTGQPAVTAIAAQIAMEENNTPDPRSKGQRIEVASVRSILNKRRVEWDPEWTPKKVV